MKHINSNKGNSFLLLLVVFAILIGGGILYYKGAKSQKDALEAPLPASSVDTTTSPPVADGVSPEIGAEDTMMEAPPLKEFSVEGKNFEFSLKEIRVTKGDFVRINLTSTGGTHDLRIDDYEVGTDVIGAGKSSSLEFMAEKAGTFEFYCSVGSHRQMGMVGKLIVE